MPSATARPGTSHARLLTALTGLGIVYFRHECPAGKAPARSSLGVRIFRSTPSTGITFRAGSLGLHRDVNDPQGKTTWFPFRTNRIQRLRLESGSEAGNHVGYVTVIFGVAGCFPWQTPSVTMRTFVVHH